jgi:hypothetical protein
LRAFKRTVKKNPELKNDIEETLRLLAKDPFDLMKISRHARNNMRLYDISK